ncbi:hypothetical protein IG631_00687 [Alternaria alternata]|nr:hypothetical protein IG631_00687 [Alternaria alternata]
MCGVTWASKTCAVAVSQRCRHGAVSAATIRWEEPSRSRPNDDEGKGPRRALDRRELDPLGQHGRPRSSITSLRPRNTQLPTNSLEPLSDLFSPKF